MTVNPLVSVVMPVYNSELFIREAIESILNQTFTNFEFIVVDDGSSDKSVEIIKEYDDPRIILIKNTVNSGNYVCRNQGNRVAKGKYIAVMDSDDIALPERLQKQVESMEKDDELFALGSDFSFLYPDGKQAVCRKQKDYGQIRLWLLHNNVALHSSLMLRQDTFEEIGYYNEEFYYSADYDMLCRLSQKGEIAGLPDLLMKYRLHEEQISSSGFARQTDYANTIRLRYLESCGFTLNKHQQELFTRIMETKTIKKSESKDALEVLNLLLEQNGSPKTFDQDLFYGFLEIIVKSLWVI